ncbi:HAMP domain-containing sensor histidine kinase [uncultured Ferrimonas sp.]|uniref:sensor histidine kinase n=1 Tax=uncultured Ferrimonas sp. TaxID=432640 RepID=UPI002625A7A6|nr:HAMP domain-containing sensor histidine kinase [uncultured Ferrimonas sp.]
MNELLLFNVYLLYGLVFFTIGCVISFRNLKFSKLAIASALPALALFGFSHALHEWSELYLQLADGQRLQRWWVEIQLLRIGKLLLSFLALMWFAWQMLEILVTRHRRWFRYLVPALLAIYTVAALVHWSVFPINHSLHLSVHLTRWMFGLLGGSLAGLALILYGRELSASRHQGAQAFSYAGLALIAYALSAGLLDSHWGLWVPLLRMLCAAVLLLALLRALKLFDQEHQDQIEAQQKRILRGEKLRAMGELASGIAHEIKTPLSYATLGCDLLEAQLHGAEGPQRQLTRIRHGLERASHISQEVLHFARHSEDQVTEVELTEVIQSALALMQYRLKSFDIRLELAPPLHVLGDAVKLEEVVINLLNNAIDACTDIKRVRIWAQPQGTRIVVGVTDWGGGMDPSLITQATSPFFSTKAQGKGTGLGLAICQQIVQQHQGELSLENGPSGLVIQFTLPRSAA